MNNIILLIVDVQNALIERQPYNKDKVVENIQNLISVARNNGKKVLYVCHNDEKSIEFKIGQHGWNVYDKIKPNKNEMIVKKEYSSAFHKTNLKEYLDNQGIDTIILVGLQTEYCIDATLKSAFDNGYKIIIPKETNSTFDNGNLTGKEIYQFYNYNIWNNRFANIISIEKVIKILENK